jgi:hypothetical protein
MIPLLITQKGKTALILAGQYGKKGCIKLLVEAGVDKGVKDFDGMSYLDYVRKAEEEQKAEVIKRNKSHYGSKPLASAAKEKSERCVKELLAVGYEDINEKDKDGYTALHYAAYNGMDSSVSDLVAAGADMEAKTDVRVASVRAMTL